MGLVNTSGKIKLLRVNEVGDRFGPAADAIQAEVIVQLDTQPADAASGFNLRVDANQPVREGMLDLLRDAFNHGWRVHFDHEVPSGKKKGRIVRVWVTKDPVAPPVAGGLATGGLAFATVASTALTPAPAAAAPSPLSGPGIRRNRPD